MHTNMQTSDKLNLGTVKSVGQLVGLDANGTLMNGIQCGGIPTYLMCHAHNIQIKNFKHYTGVTTKTN